MTVESRRRSRTVVEHLSVPVRRSTKMHRRCPLRHVRSHVCWIAPFLS